MTKTNTLALIALLALTAAAQNVVLASSGLSTNVIAPVGRVAKLESYHNANQNDFLGNGAKWIWVNGSNQNGDIFLAVTFKATFQTLFYADCPHQAASLKISADGDLTVYFNGNKVLVGDNWKKVYSADVKLTCGLNNLTITVETPN